MLALTRFLALGLLGSMLVVALVVALTAVPARATQAKTPDFGAEIGHHPVAGADLPGKPAASTNSYSAAPIDSRARVTI